MISYTYLEGSQRDISVFSCYIFQVSLSKFQKIKILNGLEKKRKAARENVQKPRHVQAALKNNDNNFEEASAGTMRISNRQSSSRVNFKITNQCALL